MNKSDRILLKKINRDLERRSRLKKKGPDAVKQPDPKRMTEAKRLLKSKSKEAENQELFLRFLDAHPDVPTTLATSETLWTFIRWLEKIGYYIIDGQTVFCFPFKKLIMLKNLK